jgi:hypothetical protein
MQHLIDTVQPWAFVLYNPDLEYVEFRKMLKTTSVKKVSLDSQLYMILENDNSLTPVCHLMNQ